MEDAPRARGSVSGYEDPAVLRYTTEYFIKLLIERHAIRSALLAPAAVLLRGTLATTEEVNHKYPTEVGNNIHLDLLDAESIVNRLPLDQRRALMEWVDGMSSGESARFSAVKPSTIRKRRERAKENAGRMWAARKTEETNA